jgi:hypothetical protein
MHKRVVRDHFVDAHEAYLNGVLDRAECRLVAIIARSDRPSGRSGVNSKANIGGPPLTQFSFMSS